MNEKVESTTRIGKLVQRVKNSERVKNWTNRFKKIITSLPKYKSRYKYVVSLFGFLRILRIFLPFEELAQICAESCLVNACGNIITKRNLEILLAELQWLPGCEVSINNLHQVVEDSQILDSEKEKQAELVLLVIEKMTNLDLKNSMIVCFVLTVSSLYFSNIIGFNILIQALINALKKGKLSSRLFNIILRMLAKRGIPIDEILEAVE